MSDRLFLISGLVLCSLAISHLLLSVLRSVMRLFADRHRMRLEHELLSCQIAAIQQQRQAAAALASSWQGWRKFRVKWKVRECDGCYSLYLVPQDSKPLPAYRPGQFVTLAVQPSGEPRPLIRCYSLSDRPRRDYYRCTIKHLAPEGRVSGYLCQELKEGDILELKAPQGSFCLDLSDERPAVLLAGGIGITPLLSMVNALVESGSRRPIFLFLGVRHGREHPFRHHLAEIAERHENFSLCVCYSRPEACDQRGRDYDHAGHLTVELLRQRLPSNNFDFYVCGPAAFMQTLIDGLIAWGVPRETVHYERFGPASVRQVTRDPVADSLEGRRSTPVTFAQSGQTCNWTPADETLLDLAEQQGIAIEAGCRAGNCGTCITAIRSGKVHYLQPPPASLEKQSCLPCICVPDGALVLDA